jgi:hypothetical protein
MLNSAATMSPVRRPDRVDLTAALAAARRALERDLKTLIDQISRSGNFDVWVVSAPGALPAPAKAGSLLRADASESTEFRLMQQERTVP